MDDYAPIAERYDHVDIYRHRPDVGFFVEEALAAGSPVLEVGSGTGRVLIPTARAGIDITGLDMRTLSLGRRFKLVTVPFRPFQHPVTVADKHLYGGYDRTPFGTSYPGELISLSRSPA